MVLRGRWQVVGGEEKHQEYHEHEHHMESPARIGEGMELGMVETAMEHHGEWHGTGRRQQQQQVHENIVDDEGVTLSGRQI